MNRADFQKMAAMRLMHLGLTVHVVGETTAPAIRSNDLLLAASGSGTTAGVERSTNHDSCPPCGLVPMPVICLPSALTRCGSCLANPARWPIWT